MQGAAVIPEYNGNPGEYTEKQITQMRQEMNRIKVLYNDVLAFQKGFEFEPIVRSGRNRKRSKHR